MARQLLLHAGTALPDLGRFSCKFSGISTSPVPDPAEGSPALRPSPASGPGELSSSGCCAGPSWDTWAHSLAPSLGPLAPYTSGAGGLALEVLSSRSICGDAPRAAEVAYREIRDPPAAAAGELKVSEQGVGEPRAAGRGTSWRRARADIPSSGSN